MSIRTGSSRRNNVNATRYAAALEKEVDELVMLDAPVHYRGAVGAYYAYFDQVADHEVIAMLASVHGSEKPDVTR